jgi:hypothetical protein
MKSSGINVMLSMSNMAPRVRPLAVQPKHRLRLGQVQRALTREQYLQLAPSPSLEGLAFVWVLQAVSSCVWRVQLHHLREFRPILRKILQAWATQLHLQPQKLPKPFYLLEAVEDARSYSLRRATRWLKSEVSSDGQHCIATGLTSSPDWNGKDIASRSHNLSPGFLPATHFGCLLV